MTVTSAGLFAKSAFDLDCNVGRKTKVTRTGSPRTIRIGGVARVIVRWLRRGAIEIEVEGRESKHLEKRKGKNE